MRRLTEDRSHRSLFDDPTGIHDGDPIGGLGDDAEVVRNQQQRQVERRLHLAQQLENLGLNRDVERRRRFVGDDERRATRQGDRDHHPLPHTAGQLVRVVAHARRRVRNVDRLHQLDRGRPRFAPRRASMDEQRFGDLIADREDRVERGHRFLKDQRDLRAANRAHVALVERQQIAALEADGAAGDPAGPLNETHDRQRGDGLPAPRLADQPERLAGANLEVDVVDRRHRAGRGIEDRREMFDCEHWEV